MKNEIFKFSALKDIDFNESEILKVKDHYPDFNDSRAKQWLAGRKLISSCLSSFEETIEIDIMQLEQENFHYLKSFPSIVCSLSHSKNAIACYLTEKNLFFNVGLDIEMKNRNIQAASRKYFVHPTDSPPSCIRKDDVDNYLWSIKESCFKCLFPFIKGEKPFVLSDIWIKENKFGVFNQHEVLGEWSEIKNEGLEDHYIISSKITSQTLKSLMK